MKQLLQLLDKYSGVIATVCMIASYIPQLILTYTTQNVSGQSLSFWVLLVTGLFIITHKSAKAYLQNKTNETLTVLGFQVPNLILAMLMLLAVIFFK